MNKKKKLTIPYDIAIINGLVFNPETNLEAIRNIGIIGEKIAAVSIDTIKGKRTIDASGLHVAPGFIDLHNNSYEKEAQFIKLRDGVTSALNTEYGALDVQEWYDSLKGKCILNYGTSVGHIPIRMAIMKDPGTRYPVKDAAYRRATKEEINQILTRLETGLCHGAIAIGIGLQYTIGAAADEILEIIRLANYHNVTVHAHLRSMGSGNEYNAKAALGELLSMSAKTNARLHISHIHSNGLSSTPDLLKMISMARDAGIYISTEVYPYTSTLTDIKAAIFSGSWEKSIGASYHDLEWVATGKRMNKKSFEKKRKDGGMVIAHIIPEEDLDMAIKDKNVVIASDGRLQDHKGHPRTSGTFSRFLGRYVREKKLLSWIEAIKKISFAPAEILSKSMPMMRKKGRIDVGADADITIFDPETIRDYASFKNPTRCSRGVKYVIISGKLVFNSRARIAGYFSGEQLRII